MPITSNIGTIYRGEDVTLNFTMSPVVDISGWTLVFNIRDERLTGDSLLTASGSVTSGAGGTFSIPLAAADTDNLDPDEYAWDVWRTDSGSAAVLALGTITVEGTPRVP
jgi:hypothetical protein